MYERLANLIKSSPHVDFGEGNGRGVSEEWIRKAEERLGLGLPPSYKWWLREYGGGEIGREEIYSIYEKEFENAAGGDIVFAALANETNGISGTEKLFICDPGTDEAWYFDTTQKNADGEYPVYFYDYTDDSSELYANSFAEFLERKIKEG